MFSVDETIVAIATAAGAGARGALRISGDEALAVCERVFRSDFFDLTGGPKTPRAVSGVMLLPEPLGDVPCEMFLWPTNRSYTRQPTAELHLVGSPAILQAALRAVCKAGARLAQPGEFTMRAFLSGRVDLTQAEAVLGVIDAEDQKQLSVALEQLAGGLSQPLASLRSKLLDLCADLEAGLDFVDEDIEFVAAEEAIQQLSAGQRLVQEIVARLASRGELSETPRVVLRGASNVGKSTLWNAITNTTPALVSDTAGTTRDYLHAAVEFDGVTFQLVDTAGVLDIENPVEIDRIATQSSERQTEHAQVVLLCLDATRAPTNWERQQLQRARTDDWIVVATKSDSANSPTEEALPTSGLTGAGVKNLLTAIAASIRNSQSQLTGVAGTAARCHDSLRRANDGLSRATEILRAEAGEELAASEIRTALEELGRVVGAIYTDDILDRVFSRFCIGK